MNLCDVDGNDNMRFVSGKDVLKENAVPLLVEMEAKFEEKMG